MRRCSSLEVRCNGGIERSADAVQMGSGNSKGSGVLRLTVQPGAHRLTMRPWSSVVEVKQRLREMLAIRPAWMRLFHASIELHNGQRLIDLLPSPKEQRGTSHHSSRHLTLQLKIQNPRDFASGSSLYPYGYESSPAATEEYDRLLSLVQQGLAMGLAPQLTFEGTGGTYIMRDARKRPVAAFKPRDEEPFTPNNPRGMPGKMGHAGIHEHVPSGEAHIREVLAHKLDWKRFSGVPLTIQAEAIHPSFYVHSVTPLSRYGTKVGSLQQWVEADDMASDRGCATFPVDEVHKIALLDMRLLNTDRNDCNILVRNLPEGKCELIPIDHGGCLPSRPVVQWFDWCWLEWPQMQQPSSDALLEYVSSIDTAAEAKLLGEFALDESAIRGCFCATRLLQLGLRIGLCLYDLAMMICREEEEVPSELERLCENAEMLVDSTLHNHRLYHLRDDISCDDDDDESDYPTTTVVVNSNAGGAGTNIATITTAATPTMTATVTTASTTPSAIAAATIAEDAIATESDGTDAQLPCSITYVHTNTLANAHTNALANAHTNALANAHASALANTHAYGPVNGISSGLGDNVPSIRTASSDSEPMPVQTAKMPRTSLNTPAPLDLSSFGTTGDVPTQHTGTLLPYATLRSCSLPFL
uniref:PI3K/PI4K catalytic domain-containing protein n=1 Tax=Chrysotila carterae TaxID=13221 RepID=A0A7S4EXI2_CHRCT